MEAHAINQSIIKTILKGGILKKENFFILSFPVQ